MPITVSNLWH